MRRALFLLLLLGPQSWADTQTDIEYAKAGDFPLKLDLHRPQASNPPLIVYVHGGAWRAGSKSDVPIAKLLDHGLAIASVDYRLSTQARFPAQIHDIKAAIRFLRANAGRFQVNADKIAIIGSSAGGHLAALAGVTNGHQELEGRIGDHVDQSSHVNCIVSFYGASNLQSILEQSTEFGRTVRIPALKLLLGDVPEKQPDLAKLASPVAHVGKADPPLWLIHGDADPQMPAEQSRELKQAYEEKKLPVKFMLMPGSKHGGAEFYSGDMMALVAEFVKAALR